MLHPYKRPTTTKVGGDFERRKKKKPAYIPYIEPSHWLPNLHCLSFINNTMLHIPIVLLEISLKIGYVIAT